MAVAFDDSGLAKVCQPIGQHLVRQHGRHVYRNGALALLVVDWAIDGTDRDGKTVHVEGTATDVARRGPDGRRRYAIDNPFGLRSQRVATEDAADPTS
ncbi:YybH family protein [Streptomyces sp. NPDC102437]|uniref:YybH family protein n=1 Tax=Streptomyces sp. NPDC102437 TaxID=3366175 RepID=UPI0038162685